MSQGLVEWKAVRLGPKASGVSLLLQPPTGIGLLPVSWRWLPGRPIPSLLPFTSGICSTSLLTFIPRSVCGCRGTDQLALTSSRLELGEEENLVVLSSACPAFLRSLLGLVV